MTTKRVYRNLPPIQPYDELKSKVVGDLQRRVWSLMFERGMSKRGLAKRADVPYTMIHGLIESGIDPKLSSLHRIAKGLGVSVTDLITPE